jgi:hypothetical protein
MSRKALAVAARWSRFLAASGALVLLARFALDATAWASERRKGVDIGAAQAHEDERAGALERVRDALEPKTDELVELATQPAGTGSAATPSEPPHRTDKTRGASSSASPQAKRRTLLVDLGPARSDVYVNGVAVGRTPYAGTWGCRDGDEVNIVVLPPGKAPPILAMAHCGNAIRADRSESSVKELDARDLALLLGDVSTGAALKQALERRGR